MKLLALETATDACSAALRIDGESLQRLEIAPRRHTELLLPMIESLCAEAGIRLGALDAIAVGVGPGAFTGVRIATAIAQGLAFAHELPMVPVSTLAALAMGGHRVAGQAHWLVLQDARRQELYWAHYEITAAPFAIQAHGPERVGAPETVRVPTGHGYGVVGGGWKVYGSRLAVEASSGRLAVLEWPEARDVATLGEHGLARGQAVPPEALAPIYLRPAV